MHWSAVQAAPLRFRTPFERNTFGDMLAINHFIGGGAKSRGQAWDEVSWRISVLRDNPGSADEEHAAVGADDDPGLTVAFTILSPSTSSHVVTGSFKPTCTGPIGIR